MPTGTRPDTEGVDEVSLAPTRTTFLCCAHAHAVVLHTHTHQLICVWWTVGHGEAHEEDVEEKTHSKV